MRTCIIIAMIGIVLVPLSFINEQQAFNQMVVDFIVAQSTLNQSEQELAEAQFDTIKKMAQAIGVDTDSDLTLYSKPEGQFTF